nr:MFS transporter [Stenotrophomonas sp. MMGLT7]
MPSLLSPRYRAATLGMVALISLIAFESLAVAAAMPTVARELDGLRLYALAFGGTLATSVVGMTAAGSWSDVHGPARPLWCGLAVFVAGLLLAGFATTMPMLVAGRMLQGLGAGAMAVALYVVVGRLYPEALRPRIFAAFSAGWVVPSLVGPALSGLIVEHIGWRWVFLLVPMLALPSMLLLQPALRTLPPAPAGRASAARIGWAGGAAAGVCLLYLAGQLHGLNTLAAALPAVVLLGTCSWRLLPRGTLRLARGLPSVIALRGIATAAFFGTEAFIPLLLSRERGLAPALAGAALSLGALGWFSGSWYQGHNRHGWHRSSLLLAGTSLLAGGIVLSTAAVWPAVPTWLAIAGWTLSGLGMGLVYPSLSILTLSLSPPHEQGLNTSALQLCEAIAVATALAIGGSLFAALLARSTAGAYLANFALAWLMALLAIAVARRTGTGG